VGSLTELQAQKLYELVCDRYGSRSARIHQIGNGELVVLVRHTRGVFYCWSFADWTRFCKRVKAWQQAAREKAAV
jgi:hypothetical protein